MNSDIRIAVGLTFHPKTIKLMRRCGDRAFFCLIQLWAWAAQNRPDGSLAGMDAEAVEIAAGWIGGDGAFAAELVAVGYIDGDECTWVLHDWSTHNSWVAKADERSDSARLSRLARVNPSKALELKAQGRLGVTAEEYADYTTAQRTHNERSTTAVRTATTPAPAPAPKGIKAEEDQGGKSDPKAPPSAAAAYEFELPDGQLVRLLQRDLEKWEKSYRHIDVYAELQAIADKSPEGRAKWTKANWFQTLSAWLRAANTRAKAADPTFDPGDPTGEKRRAREDQEQREYFERHGIPTLTGPIYTQNDYLYGRVPGCIGYQGDGAKPVQLPEGGTMNPAELVAQVAAKLQNQEPVDGR